MSIRKFKKLNDNQLKLLYMIKKEFCQALTILNKNYPDRKFRTITWLLPEKYVKILNECGFDISPYKTAFWNRKEIIWALSKFYKTRTEAKQHFSRHTVYKISWTKREAEKLLSYENKSVNKQKKAPLGG